MGNLLRNIQNRNISRRLLGFLLAFAMLVSMVPGTLMVKAAGDNHITVHFYNADGWDKVNAYLGEGDSWSAVSGYEAFNAWPGSALSENATHSDWFDLEVSKAGTDALHLIFNNGDSLQSANIDITEVSGEREYWYVNGSLVSTAPSLWTGVASYHITVHYKSNWSTVNAYVTEGASWTAISGYESYATWPGGPVSANADNSGWFDLEVTKATDARLNFIFNDGGSNQTADLVVDDVTEEVECWVEGNNVSYTAPADWLLPGNNITVHYYNANGWDPVYCYATQGSTWNVIPGFEAYGAWPGAVVSANATHEGWVDLKLNKASADQLNCIFNNNRDGQTENLYVTEINTVTECWVEDGKTVTYTAPESWGGEPVPQPPVKEDKIKVTNLVQVKLGDSLYTMDVFMNGVYEASVPVAAGDYTATLVVDGEETDITVSATAEADGTAILRLKDNALQVVTVAPAALVGNFAGLEFVDAEGTRYDIAAWAPADANAELEYLGGGLYKRTFLFGALEEDLTLADGGYKVAFNDSWDYSIGDGSDNIALTLPAGTASLTVLVDEVNGIVYDSIRSGSFELAQNSGSVQKPALDTVVSLIGDVRGTGTDDWSTGTRGFEFTQISDTLFRYQKTFEAGTYNYKCVFDYASWYEAEGSGNRSFTLTEKTHVVFLYDTATGRLYDTVNNTATVGELLGMQAPPAEMKVTDNANGTTTFTAVGEDGQNVTLNYCDRANPAKVTTVWLGKVKDGAAKSDAIFLGDDALDILYWYDVDGVRTLDSSNPTVTLDGADYSNYTRDAFTGRLITVPGTFPGPSWDPASNAMTYEGNGRYIYTFKDTPAANYQYKIATGSWSENYGAGGVVDGPNILVTVPTTQDVTIYYNDFSHYAACSVDYILADVTLSGTGIPEGTRLTDDYLIGIYTVTVPMAAGTYTDVKITFDGKDYVFESIEVAEDKDVTFYFDPVTGIFYCNASNVELATELIYFNSRDTAYKSVYGAVATGEKVTFAIDTGEDATAVTLVVKGLNARSLPMEKSGAAVDGVQKWAVTTSFETLSENSYYFAISNGSSVKIYADDDGYYGEGTVTDLTNIKAYDLVVYQSGFETPDWMKNAVIYQIFPDRFFDGDECNNNDQTTARGAVDYEYITDWYTLPENPDQELLLTKEEYMATGAHWGDGEWNNEIYGGDLRGIMEKIDYLKALGVNVIYLNPVFSSISSHRYDACDYTKIDPILGDLGDFTELVKVAEENDMHIILDGVFNHVSDDSVYFDRYYKFLGKSEKIGAYPYWAYVYDYMAEKGVEQPAAEAAAKTYFTENYGITDFSYTEWFVINNTDLIDLSGNIAVDTIGLRAGKTVYGYEGWWGYDNMPVIKSTNGSEYQTGNWAEEIIYNEDGTSVTQYWLSEGSDGWRLDVANEVSDETWQKFRESVKALDSDAVIVGEIWTDATEYLLGDMYDSVMNYMFRNAVTSFAMGGTAEDSTNTLERLRERYPEEAFYAMMNLVSSHDTSRILSYLDGIGDDRTDTSVAAAFPTYEATSDLAKNRQYLVSFLQFTYAGAPTIYYGDEIGMVGADDPDDRRGFTWGKGNKDIVTWYATLANIRSQYSALRTGTVEPFEAGESIMAYVRRDSANAMVILANNRQDAQSVTLDLAELGITAKTLTDVISGKTYTVENGKVTVSVDPLRGVILTENVVEGITVNQEALKPAYDAAYVVEPRKADKVCALDQFTDAPATDNWAHTGIDFVLENGLFFGVTDELFVPNGTMTRGMLVAVLWRLEGRPASSATTKFTDVPANQYYATAVSWAYSNGVISGMTDTRFAPNSNVTREQMASILYRYARYKGYDLSAQADLSKFPDSNKVSDYAVTALAWANAEGLISGTITGGTTILDPRGNATRAQVASIFMRYIKYIVND